MLERLREIAAAVYAGHVQRHERNGHYLSIDRSSLSRFDGLQLYIMVALLEWVQHGSEGPSGLGRYRAVLETLALQPNDALSDLHFKLKFKQSRTRHADKIRTKTNEFELRLMQYVLFHQQSVCRVSQLTLDLTGCSAIPCLLYSISPIEASLSQSQSLRRLDLVTPEEIDAPVAKGIADALLRYAAPNSSLEELRLHVFHLQCTALIEALQTLRGLRTLHITVDRMTPTHNSLSRILHQVAAHPKLSSLYLRRVSNSTQTDWEQLNAVDRTQPLYLCFEQMHLPKGFLPGLERFTSRSDCTVSFSRCEFHDSDLHFLPAVLRHGSVNITLEHCSGQKEGAPVKAVLLHTEGKEHIMSLHLKHMGIHKSFSLSPIFNSAFPRLQSLNIADNCLPAASMSLIASYLHDPLCQVHTLNLSGNPIADDGVEALLRGLYGNTKLKSIGLGRIKVTAFGMQKLLTCLTSTHVYDLDIAWNPIMFKDSSSKNPMAMSLCSLLFGKRFPSLQCLNISGWRLGENVYSIIAEALHDNSTLIELKLCRTFPGVCGLERLGLALLGNKRLRHLDLSRNNTAVQMCFGQLMVCIERNKGLEELWLRQTCFSLEDLAALAVLLRKNPRIADLAIDSVAGIAAAQAATDPKGNQGSSQKTKKRSQKKRRSHGRKNRSPAPVPKEDKKILKLSDAYAVLHVLQARNQDKTSTAMGLIRGIGCGFGSKQQRFHHHPLFSPDLIRLIVDFVPNCTPFLSYCADDCKE